MKHILHAHRLLVQRLLCGILLTAGFGSVQAQTEEKTTSILFIGNSYTYFNDLPALVKNLALAGGDSVVTDAHTPGGQTFQGHLADPVVKQKIQSRKWDYVVLQEQSQRPSFPPGQTENEVFPYAKQLCEMIRESDSCTKVVFFMTWGRKYGDPMNCPNYRPLCTFEGMQERISITYRDLARRNSALVVPAGMAWKASIEQDSLVNLFEGDNSHPNLTGSYLTACTFYATMFRKPATGLAYYGGLADSQAIRLQGIATATALDSLDEWTKNLPFVKASFSATLENETKRMQFTNLSQGGRRYQWSFGDGKTSAEIQPQHEYENSGKYNVTLIVENGCEADTFSDSVTVIRPTSRFSTPKSNEILLYPTVFRENIHLKTDLLAEIRLKVMDLTGKTVFEGQYHPQTEPLTLSLQHLPAGIYLTEVRIHDNGTYKTVEHYKIIKE